MTKRRQFLRSGVGASLATILAGCSSGNGGSSDKTGTDTGGGETPGQTVTVSSGVKNIVKDLPDHYPDDYGQTVQKAKNEGQLKLYTAHFGSLYESYLKEFNKKFPFIDVKAVSLPTPKVFSRFSTEASQDKYVPDLVHTYDPVSEAKFNQLGIIQNYESPEKSFYKDDWMSDDGTVVSPNFNPYVNAWNPNQMSGGHPGSLPALANAIEGNVDAWDGNFAMYDGMLSASMWQTMLQWDRVYGRDKMTKHLKTLAKANPKTFWSTSTMGKWVATGEVQYGIALAEFILKPYVRPDYGKDQIRWGPDEDVISITHLGGYSMVKEPTNPNAAKLFYDWYLSKQAQQYFTNNWSFVTARKDIGADDVEDTFNIPGGEDVPMTYDAISDLTPFIPSYKYLSDKGSEKQELKKLWYQTFVA